MAQREKDKNQTISELVEMVSNEIINLKEGEEASINRIVGYWFEDRGYEFTHIDTFHGYVWIKDKGETYAIEDQDQFDILRQVTERLKGKYILDFSRYENMCVGLPYNLFFTVRKIEKQ